MKDEIALLRELYPDVERDERVLTVEKEKLMASIRATSVAEKKPSASIPPRRLIPHLIYDDVAGAIEWLGRAFGFRELTQYRHLDTDGSIGHAELRVGDSPDDPVIMLGPPGPHGESPSKGVSAALYLYVSNVDGHYNRAIEAGATVALPLRNQPWGDRHYQVTDPEGHQWQFAERLRDH